MYKHRTKEEEEEAVRRQLYLESLNQKRELIRSEFEKIQDENHFDELTLKSDSDIPFKALLNEMRRDVVRKQEKLSRSESQLLFPSCQSASSSQDLEIWPSKAGINASFSKSYYRNRMLQSLSAKEGSRPEALARRLAELKRDIENSKGNYETEVMNRSSIQGKLMELEDSKKKMLLEMNELSFAKRMTFKRFTNMDAMLFSAQTKKMLSLQHLSQAKTEIGKIKSIEGDFFKQRVAQIQQEKFEIDREHSELSKVLLLIDNAKVRLANTEKELQDLEIQEEQLNDQKMETFYVKEYIGFFSEFKSLFLQNEIERFLAERENQMKIEEGLSPRHAPSKSPSKVFEGFRSATLRSPWSRNKKITSSPTKPRRELDTHERLSIVRRIFEFLREHQNLDELVKQVLKVHTDLMIQSNSLSRQYEEIMALKKRRTKDLEVEVKSLETLRQQNMDIIAKTENPGRMDLELENENYSLNAGVLVGFYDKELTTVNRLRQEVFPVSEITAAEMQQYKDETLENEKFVFSAYLNISSKILLLSDMILLISEIGEGSAPASLTRLCEGIKAKVLNKKTIPKGEKTLMAPINDISFDKITCSFGLYFDMAKDLGILRTFYGLLKNDRTMSGFLNMEVISQFFKSIAAKGRDRTERVLERFEELKSKAYEMQTRRLSQLFESLGQIFEELAIFKESKIESGLYRKVVVSMRRGSEVSSSFNLRTQKKQIDKIKLMNFPLSEEEIEREKTEFSMKRIDTLEDLSRSRNYNYKPSYFFGVEESSPKKDEERSETEIFEENRLNIKNEISGSVREVLRREVRRSENLMTSMKLPYQQDQYLRDMLRISAEKNNIEQMEKRTAKIEPILEFQHQLKAQKEKTIYNLYHADLLNWGEDKGYNTESKGEKAKGNQFKIKTKALNKGKTNKTANQTSSTIVPTSRAQTSSTNTRKKIYFLEPEYWANFSLAGGLDYDVLFNKTEDDNKGLSFSSTKIK